MKIPYTVTLHFEPGVTLKEVVTKMPDIAGRLGVPVDCTFNGVTITAKAGCDPLDVMQRYYDAHELLPQQEKKTSKP